MSNYRRIQLLPPAILTLMMLSFSDSFFGFKLALLLYHHICNSWLWVALIALELLYLHLATFTCSSLVEAETPTTA